MRKQKVFKGETTGFITTAEMDIDSMIERSYWRDILYEIISTMDPWDINIAELATRYSAKVEKMREMNFRIPANVVLVSSILLRMKADIVASVNTDLLEFAAEEDSGLDFSELNIEAYSEAGNGVDASTVSDSRNIGLNISPKRVVKRRVTAAELIAAIQEVLEDRRIRNRLEKECGNIRELQIPLSVDIKKLIEDTYQKVMSILSQKKDQVVLFSEMVPKKEEIIPTFLSLLHLSNDQRVSLKQERLYEEIFISIR